MSGCRRRLYVTQRLRAIVMNVGADSDGSRSRARSGLLGLGHKQAGACESDDDESDRAAYLEKKAIHGVFLQSVKRRTGANSLISEEKLDATTTIWWINR